MLPDWKTVDLWAGTGGEGGVSHVLKALIGDLDLTLHLSGIPSVSRDVLNQKLLLREEEL